MRFWSCGRLVGSWLLRRLLIAKTQRTRGYVMGVELAELGGATYNNVYLRILIRILVRILYRMEAEEQAPVEQETSQQEPQQRPEQQQEQQKKQQQEDQSDPTVVDTRKMCADMFGKVSDYVNGELAGENWF